MTDNKSGIDLIERLDALLKFILEKFDPDIIVPIERKGIRVLELSQYADSLSLLGSKKILYYSSIEFHAEELKNKKIVLFDESVGSGISLRNKLDKLSRLSKNKNLKLKIKTAALLIHEKVNNLPNFYLKDLVCNQDLYDVLSDELMFKILSTGKPLDVDHPIAKLILRAEDIPNLLNHLNEISYTQELAHSREFSNVRMFTVDFINNFHIPKFDTYPKLYDEGPKKVRLFLKNNEMRCIPIVYPCLDITKNTLNDYESCKFCEKNNGKSKSFCDFINLSKTLEKNPDKIQQLRANLCYQCITYEMNCLLLGFFLHELNQKINFDYIGLDDFNLNAIYHNEADELKKFLEIKINHLRNGNAQKFSGDFTDPCQMQTIPLLERKYHMGIPRTEYEITHTIRKNAQLNQSLYEHEQADYGMDRPKLGLSYNQIFNSLSGLNEHAFSGGMDIALDIGLIKPDIPPKGIKIKHNNEEFLGLTRMYCTSSEDIDKSVEFFFDLISISEDT